MARRKLRAAVSLSHPTCPLHTGVCRQRAFRDGDPRDGVRRVGASGVDIRRPGYLQYVRHRSRISNVPVRLAAGAFILNSGLTKLQADKETHHHLHGFASGAYPFLENAPPEQFGKTLAGAEIALGSALLAPVVIGDGLAGLALTSFAGGLVGLYLKTPGMRQEGSIRPSKDGTALAKDTWLVGIGLSLMASSIGLRRTVRLERKAKRQRHEADRAEKAEKKQRHASDGKAAKAIKAAAVAKAAKVAAH